MSVGDRNIMSHLWFIIYTLQENLNLETVKQQFDIVKKETNTSHVTEWGEKVCSMVAFCGTDCTVFLYINKLSLSRNDAVIALR
jgi:hypothetical protein